MVEYRWWLLQGKREAGDRSRETGKEDYGAGRQKILFLVWNMSIIN